MFFVHEVGAIVEVFGDDDGAAGYHGFEYFVWEAYLMGFSCRIKKADDSVGFLCRGDDVFCGYFTKEGYVFVACGVVFYLFVEP